MRSRRTLAGSSDGSCGTSSPRKARSGIERRSAALRNRVRDALRGYQSSDGTPGVVRARVNDRAWGPSATRRSSGCFGRLARARVPKYFRRSPRSPRRCLPALAGHDDAPSIRLRILVRVAIIVTILLHSQCTLHTNILKIVLRWCNQQGGCLCRLRLLTSVEGSIRTTPSRSSSAR